MFPWCCFCRACLNFPKPKAPWLSSWQPQLCGTGFFLDLIWLPEQAKAKELLLPYWDFVVVVSDFFGPLV